MSYAYLATRLFNTPLMISPAKAEIILAALAGRLGIAGLRLPDGRLRAFDSNGEAMAIDGLSDDDGPGYEVIGGVAIIEIRGTLVQRQMGLRPVSGLTGYGAIRQNFCMALGDEAVKAIAFDIDSPGGDVAGCFDLTDEIYLARGRKPIWAILDETAASAAYALAAACDRVIVPRTGYAGSIGVIVLHVDLSRMLEKEGVTVTVLQFGDRKADGQPAIPLSDPAREALQADIDTVGELFVNSVAYYRGLEPARVRATEAAVFLGQAGVKAGLVDAVMAPSEAFAALVKLAKQSTTRGPRMPSRQEMFGPGRPGAAIVSVAVREMAKLRKTRKY
jgi:signal peptide peptidase SppA